MKLLIKNALIVNENTAYRGDLLIENGLIQQIKQGNINSSNIDKIIDGTNKLLIPGVIDDQVHFREPGLTHKAEIYSESKAAVAGGITSFMEMPNTNPQTTSIERLDAKFKIAEQKSLANYSFYFGATNDNIEEIKKINKQKVCGIKVFMGSSTGNMLVDNIESLNLIFSEAPTLVAVHCEDEEMIQYNIEKYKNQYGEGVPMYMHPIIRSEEACYKSSSLAVKLAKKHNTKLHVLHISTKKELDLFDNSIPLKEKKISAEVCVHHLWFDDSKYNELGSKIKWNPAIKSKIDREELFNGMLNDKLDVIATDHAPHTLAEKSNSYFKAPSGGPLVQHSLQLMLEFYKKGKISIEKIVEKMCHNPAILFNVEKRGFIREGYWADLVLIDLDTNYKVSKENILSKCKWSPFEDSFFQTEVTHTFVNGNLVYENGNFYEAFKGQALKFNR